MKKKVEANEKNEANNTKKGKKKKNIFKTIIIIIIIIIIVFGIWFAYKVNKNGGGIKGITSTIVGSDTEKTKNLPMLQCVIMGESLNLTDTIMVCSYDPKTQEASIMSIPRDTFIGKNKNRATAYDKINSLYQKGPENTVEAINDITGLNIKYYVAVDTKALRQLVDELGGVEFYVPIDMDYDDSEQDLYIHLEEGLQVLDGDKAEQLLRFRHNNDGTSYPEEYGDNDLGRMKTQQEFIMTVAKQVLKPENIFKINKFIDIAKENVTTNLNFEALRDYIPYAVEFNTESIKTGTLPGEPEKCNGVWLYVHNEEETEALVNDMFIEKSAISEENAQGNIVEENEIVDDDTTINNVKIEILNGTGSKSKLNNLKEKLEDNGFNVTKTGTTSVTNTTTIINRTSVSTNIENDILTILGTGNISNGSNNSKVDITIILGKDY